MKKEECRLLIKSDLYRYKKKNDLKTKVISFITSPGFRYMYLHRKYNLYKSNNRKILKNIFKLMLIRYRILYGYEISMNTSIGAGFYINHLGPIVVNPDCVIGKNVNIHNGVTLGQENRGKRKGAPIIGDSVWIGANSIIVGNVKIGNNVLIAPNSYINFDVPNNSIAIGNPAIIKYKDNATESYIDNRVR